MLTSRSRSRTGLAVLAASFFLTTACGDAPTDDSSSGTASPSADGG